MLRNQLPVIILPFNIKHKKALGDDIISSDSDSSPRTPADKVAIFPINLNSDSKVVGEAMVDSKNHTSATISVQPMVKNLAQDTLVA